MFRIVNPSIDSAPVKKDPITMVTRMLPSTCVELRRLLNRDKDNLFANKINYNSAPLILEDKVYGLEYLVAIGNSFINPGDLSGTAPKGERVKHGFKKLECPLSIGIKRSMGEYANERFDFVQIQINAVSEFVGIMLPKIIGGDSGSAKLHSWSKALANETQVCKVLDHINSLDGDFTAELLIDDLNKFNSTLNISTEKELVGMKL